jgi:threonine dehydrogenase-like Zn-dependent dehydrogenase
MMASRLHGILDLRLDMVEKPHIDSTEVLLEIKAASMCGTDIQIYHNTASVHPFITGHEYSGIVSEVGKDVKGFEIGDRVVGVWGLSCGKCWYCRHGSPNLCRPMKVFGTEEINGSHAEYMRVPMPERVLTKLPNEISFEEGALISCSLSTGMYGAERAKIGIGDTVAVFGLGGVGMSTVLAAKLAGASHIIAIDPLKYRRELAKRLGADMSLDAKDLDEMKTMKFIAEGGVDRTVVATTAPSAIGQAVEVTRRGGRLAVVGDVEEASIDWTHFHSKDMDIAGVLGMIGSDYIKKVVTMVHNGKIDPKQYKALITHKLPLTEIKTAYEIFDKKQEEILKIIIMP